MSLDLYEREVDDVVSQRSLTTKPEIGVWDGFARGTGLSAMQTFAKAGRAASLALAPAAVAADLFTDGTEIQDRFFRAHDEVFGSAVDHWTPRPDEVGVAGQITGQLLATLPMIIASPAATVAATGLGTAEDLTRKGVDTDKAIATGMVQAGGLGLGIYVPILGKTLAQRVLIGGAGFNLFQGVSTRAASELILEGTPAAQDFAAFDRTSLTLDLLLGSAFGAIAHLSPAQRAQGAKFYERIDAWSKSLKPSDVDALLVMRAAQHVNADSLPGKPVDPESMGNHAARTRRAIEQLARDERVDVSDLPEGRFEVDEPRMSEMAARAEELVRAAEEVRKTEGIPPIRLFHGTGFAFDDFRFDGQGLGPHFGTLEQANAVAEDHRILGNAPNIRPVDLLVKNPLRLDDKGLDIPGLLAEQLEAKGLIPSGRAVKIGASIFDGKMTDAQAFEELRVAINKAGYDAVVYANRYEGSGDSYIPLWSDQIRSAFSETEGPPARVSAEPPPPRSEGERPGGPEAKGEPPAPEVLEARRFADERGDLEVTVGRDNDGNPVKMKLKQMLDDSDAAVKLANDDAKLFEIAAACMLGGS